MQHPVVNETALQAVYRVADAAGMPVIDPDKVRPVSLHNLITNLLEIARCFVNDEVHIPEFASYIVHYFVLDRLTEMNKHQRKTQCSHAMYTMLYSWKGFMELRMECRLIATMLEGERGSKNTLKNFLRIRKEITKINPLELLDEIFLMHGKMMGKAEETIAIVHRLYEDSRRKPICKWLNDFYINMNYRQVNNAKLQSCIFVEFLLNCQGEMASMEQEVRIISKTSRKENPGLFTSRIDKNNGFTIVKGRVDLNKQCTSDRFSQSKISYSKVVKSPIKEQSPGDKQMKRTSRQKLTEMHSNQIVSRLFDPNQESPKKSSYAELSPARRLFLTAEKSFQKLSKIDQQLDSRRDFPIYQPKHKRQNSVSRDHSSSNLVQKYTQDWEKMIERNESFKEKMLKKSRGLVEERRRMLEDSMDGVIYERLGSPGKLKGDLQSYQESSNQRQSAGQIIEIYDTNPFKNNFENFSFKDNLDHDQHFEIQEIRQSVKVKTLFK